MKQKRLLSIFMAFLMASSLFGCTIENDKSFTNDSSSQNITTTPTTESESIPDPEPVANPSVRLVAAGDNLIHSNIYKQAQARATDGGYDFDFLYENVADLISGADIAILNQETPIANDKLPLSNYPQFNSPVAVGEKVIDLGFNVFSIANNHILDVGEEGLGYTLDFWDSHPEVTVYGAYRNLEDMDNIRTREVNGIKFAFVGGMEHTNGLKLPLNSEYELLYLSNEERLESDIKKADEMADVVIVSAHYGVEVTNEVSDYQKSITKKMVEWGADLIIGTQPHTVQTMEYLDKPDGGQAFVFYCLGNFVSSQSSNLAMIGMLADLNITKDLKTGEIIIDEIKAIPLITHFGSNFSNVTVYPYIEYTSELANSHGIRSQATFNMDLIDMVIDENIPKEFLKLD